MTFHLLAAFLSEKPLQKQKQKTKTKNDGKRNDKSIVSCSNILLNAVDYDGHCAQSWGSKIIDISLHMDEYLSGAFCTKFSIPNLFTTLKSTIR